MNKKFVFLLLFALTFPYLAFSQFKNIFSGTVTDEEGVELIGSTVFLDELGTGDETDTSGKFYINNIPPGKYSVLVSYVGYTPITKEIEFQQGEQKNENFILLKDEQILLEVEVFGKRRERPKKMDALTRIPLRLDEQVQRDRKSTRLNSSHVRISYAVFC